MLKNSSQGFLEKSLWSLVDKSKFERLAVRISCTVCGQAGDYDTKWKVRERQPTTMVVEVI